MKNIAENKKAKFDYYIVEKYEAGLVLTGSEVKSLRINTGSIKESYIIEKDGELWLSNCHIKQYSSSLHKSYDPIKRRKILLKKKEMHKIIGSSRKDGMTILPLNMYFNLKGLVKIQIGVGRGKKKYDKRALIKAKEWSINKQRIEKNRKSN